MSDVMTRRSLDASDDTVRITLRLTQRQLDRLDERRGGTNRSTYLRWLIDHEQKPASQIRAEPVPPVAPPVERNHLHRFKKTGPSVGYQQGVPVYPYRCDCDATKIDR